MAVRHAFLQPRARLMVAALVGVAVTSGCGDQAPPPSVARSISMEASPSANAAPGTSKPDEWENLKPPRALSSDEIALTCASPVEFHADALQGPRGVETAGHPAAAALRRFISTDVALRGREGWYLAALTESQALFLVPGSDSDGGYWYAEFSATEGPWQNERSGSCEIRPSFGDFGPATWALAPGQSLTPATVVLDVLVGELACASGNSPEGRVVPAAAVYLEDAVVVIFGVRPLPGAQTCQASPPAEVRLELGEPLGDRELLDGSEFPPVWRGGPTE